MTDQLARALDNVRSMAQDRHPFYVVAKVIAERERHDVARERTQRAGNDKWSEHAASRTFQRTDCDENQCRRNEYRHNDNRLGKRQNKQGDLDKSLVLAQQPRNFFPGLTEQELTPVAEPALSDEGTSVVLLSAVILTFQRRLIDVPRHEVTGS